MNVISRLQIEIDRKTSAARVAICQEIDAAGLTRIQAVHLLASMLADHTRKLEGEECRDLVEAETDSGQ